MVWTLPGGQMVEAFKKESFTSQLVRGLSIEGRLGWSQGVGRDQPDLCHQCFFLNR